VWQSIQTAALNTASSLAGLSAAEGALDPDVLAKAQELTNGIGIQDVNQMRSIAGQNVSAFETLNSTSGEMAIDDTMIARPPVFGTGPGTGLPESYTVRVEYTGIDETGAVVSDYYTLWLDQLPDTVTDLQSLVEADARNRALLGADSLTAISILSIDSLFLSQV